MLNKKCEYLAVDGIPDFPGDKYPCTMSYICRKPLGGKWSKECDSCPSEKCRLKLNEKGDKIKERWLWNGSIEGIDLAIFEFRIRRKKGDRDIKTQAQIGKQYGITKQAISGREKLLRERKKSWN